MEIVNGRGPVANSMLFVRVLPPGPMILSRAGERVNFQVRAQSYTMGLGCNSRKGIHLFTTPSLLLQRRGHSFLKHHPSKSPSTKGRGVENGVCQLYSANTPSSGAIWSSATSQGTKKFPVAPYCKPSFSSHSNWLAGEASAFRQVSPQ